MDSAASLLSRSALIGKTITLMFAALYWLNCFFISFQAATVKPTTTTIPSQILKRILTVPEFRASYNSSGTMACGQCQCNMSSNSTIIQWEWLEFCNTMCFQSFILKYSTHGCAICSKDCDFYCELPVMHVYGNRLYVFCSDQCAKVFFNLAPFCRYCRRIVDPAKMLNGFCHAMCQQKFDALDAAASSTTIIKQICCIECGSTTNPNIRLWYAGCVYGFCSHRCYFYRTLQCRLFPGMH